MLSDFLLKWCLLLNLKTHSFSSQVNSIGQNLSRLGNFFLGRKFTDPMRSAPSMTSEGRPRLEVRGMELLHPMSRLHLSLERALATALLGISGIDMWSACWAEWYFR